jgi:uncharacterized protein YbjT (DUF2867 family)
MRAIIFGSTGLTGHNLLEKLIDNEHFEEVICFVRSALPHPPEKVTYIITDFTDLQSHGTQFADSVIFCCLGTTMRKVNFNRDAFTRVDLDLPMEIAWLAKRHHAAQLIVVTALGANRRSPVFYSRIKGMLEFRLQELALPSLHIIQPSFLTGRRPEQRMGERVALIALQLISPLLRGPLRKFRPIAAATVADAMVKIAGMHVQGMHIWPSDRLQSLSRQQRIE